MFAAGRRLIVLGIMLALDIGPAGAENFDAGKSGSALFAKNCTACHRTARGLAKDRSSGSVTDFLRQHYTTSPATADELAAYLLAAGGDPRRAKQSPAAEREPERAGRSPRRPVEPSATTEDRPDLAARPRRRATLRAAEPGREEPSQPSGRRRSRPSAGEPADAKPPTAAAEPERAPAAGKRRKQSAARRTEPGTEEKPALPGEHRGPATGAPPVEPQRPVASERATPPVPVEPEPPSAAPPPSAPASRPRAPEPADQSPAFSVPSP